MCIQFPRTSTISKISYSAYHLSFAYSSNSLCSAVPLNEGALVLARTETISVLPLDQADTPFIIFIPQTDRQQAAFLYEPSITSAAAYVSDLFSSYENFQVAILSRKYQSLEERADKNAALLPVYEGNLRLLEVEMTLEDFTSDIVRDQSAKAKTKRHLVAEETKLQNSLEARERLEDQIAELEEELKKIHGETDMMLQAQVEISREKREEWGLPGAGDFREETGQIISEYYTSEDLDPPPRRENRKVCSCFSLWQVRLMHHPLSVQVLVKEPPNS